MIDKMMALGQFVFCLQTLPYTELQQQLAWRHASNSRVGARAKSQFLGVDEEKITLNGTLYPELTGGEEAIDTLRKMADAGDEYPLVDGTGRIYGFFVIESITPTRSEFFGDGAARKIGFSISMKRTDDDEVDTSPQRGYY